MTTSPHLRSPIPSAVDQAPFIERLAESTIPTRLGTFRFFVYRSTELPDSSGSAKGPRTAPFTSGLSNEHVALVFGEVSQKTGLAARVHSECLTSEAFGSLKCDCREQLEAAKEFIAAEGQGVIVYLRQEGRGIGLANKIRAYALQELGADTVEANRMLHLPIDARDYGVAAAILRDLGVGSVRLMTNNPDKVSGLADFGIQVVERLPLVVAPNPHSAAYLEAKRARLKHELP